MTEITLEFLGTQLEKVLAEQREMKNEQREIRKEQQEIKEVIVSVSHLLMDLIVSMDVRVRKLERRE